MKSVLPLIALAIFASSCSTAYKSGQTPDDVYFSPEPKPYVSANNRDGNDYAQLDRENERQYRNNNNRRQQYADPEAYYDDRYLRMKVRNRRMWSDLDYYYSDPYAYRYMDPFWGGIGVYSAYSYWNPYMAWGHHYNPYYRPYSHVIISNPQSPVYSRPRTSNLNVYNRPNAPVYSTPRGSINPKSYNNGNNRSYSQPRDFGSDIRSTFGNNSSNNNSSSTPSRSTINSNNSSSSGSSSSGGGRSSGGSAPVRKF